MGKSAVRLNGVRHSFDGDVLVLNDISSHVSNTRIAVVGINGSGKSTLLRIIAGTISPSWLRSPEIRRISWRRTVVLMIIARLPSFLVSGF